jgi:predicted dehydrogenase
VGSLVKWGIVSTADINRKVIPGRARVGEGRLRRRCQPRPCPSRGVRPAEWEIPRAYGSYEDLLADPEIEAVYISLPNTLHAEWSIKALEAGKHVLCEKPFTRHPDEVVAAFDAAERSSRLLSEAFMYRHNPQTAKLVELVHDGAIGELRLIRSAFSYGLYDAENIRLRTDVEGGALMDVGCYNVSGSRLLGASRSGSGARRGTGLRERTGSSTGHCVFPATCSPRSIARPHSQSATSSRRSAARARSSSTIPGTACTR